jgi:hypothetical protein
MFWERPLMPAPIVPVVNYSSTETRNTVLQPPAHFAAAGGELRIILSAVLYPNRLPFAVRYDLLPFLDSMAGPARRRRTIATWLWNQPERAAARPRPFTTPAGNASLGG